MTEITKSAALLAAASGIVFGVVTPLSASAAEEPLKWTRCAGSGLDPRQQCATLEVPMDYAHPGGRTIDIGDISNFAQLTGDYYPLHIDEEAGKAGRFGRLLQYLRTHTTSRKSLRRG